MDDVDIVLKKIKENEEHFLKGFLIGAISSFMIFLSFLILAFNNHIGLGAEIISKQTIEKEGYLIYDSKVYRIIADKKKTEKYLWEEKLPWGKYE